jgi:2-polyprenyl-6-methoxyphenol hydroxylase-like FAD-dependent oxidoreductase
MSNRHVKILILGGGPAGTATALSLARLGHEPLLVSAPRRQAAIEGFSDRTMQALETLGFVSALDAVGPKVGRRAFWGADESRVNAEFVVDRKPFDAALLADVEARGIEILHERAARVTRSGPIWQVHLASSTVITADFLVEARGRAAPVPSRERLQGPATVSLARVWRGVDETPATAVAGMRDGWSWYASAGGGRAMLQFLVSAEPGVLPKRHGLAAYYGELLRASGLPREWVSGGEPVGEVVVRRANPIGANHPLGEHFIRIGDAAIAPDPLSGHGVYVALGGAQAAAVTINTLLGKPENANLARSFYEERCSLDFMRLCRVGRAFYEEERRWPDRPFWRHRSDWPDHEPPHPPMDAFPPRIERRPVVVQGFIAEHEVVVAPDHPRGVWVVDGVPLAALRRALLARGRKADIDRLAKELGRPRSSIDLAHQWLSARSLI